MDVKVTVVKIIKADIPLKAFAEVVLDGVITLREFRVIQEPNQAAYIKLPQTTWNSPQGKKYRTVLSLPNSLRWQVTSAILAAYQEEVRKCKDDEKQDNKTRVSK